MDHSVFRPYAADAMDVPFFDTGMDTGIVPHSDDWGVHGMSWDGLNSTPYSSHQGTHPKPSCPDASQRSIAFLNHSDLNRSMEQYAAMSPCPEECHEECHSPDCNEPDCEAALIECTDAACMAPSRPGSCTGNGSLCAGELPPDVLNGAVQLHSLRPHQPSDHLHYAHSSYPTIYNNWAPHESIHSSPTQYDGIQSSSPYSGVNMFNDGHPHSQQFFSIDDLCYFDGDNSLCGYHGTQHEMPLHVQHQGLQQILNYSTLPNNMPLTDPSTSSSSPVPQMTHSFSSEPTPSSISPYPSPHQAFPDSSNNPFNPMLAPRSADIDPNAHICLWSLDNGMGTLCHQQFPTKEALQRHVQDKHTATLSKAVGFVCRWHDCSRLQQREIKGFAQRSKLDRHIQSHTGYKASTCPICDKDFSTQQTLDSHLRTHTGDKPFVCREPGCGYKAAQASQLTMHTRTKHTKVKPLKCEICGAKFAESSNLSKHRKIHLPEENVRCNLCGKTFRRKDQLKRHEKTHVKRAERDERRRSEVSEGLAARSSVSTSVGFDEPLKLAEEALKKEDEPADFGYAL